MRKFKCRFFKSRNGQQYFERSIPFESVQVLFILADDVKIHYKKNKNKIVFTYHRKELNHFCEIHKVPDHIAQKFLPMESWSE